MNKISIVKSINLIVRFLTIISILLPAIANAQQTCNTNTQISLYYPDCVKSNETFDLIYHLSDYKQGFDNSTNKIEILDNVGNVITSQNYTLSAEGEFANYFQLKVSSNVDYSIRYYSQENNCYKTEFLPLRVFPQYEIIKSDISCNGKEDGKIIISALNGSQFDVLWNNGITSNQIENLVEGKYTVTVSSTNGCEITELIKISNPSPLNVVIRDQAVICSGTVDNVLKANVTGGTEPYYYDWSYDGTGDFDDAANAHFMQSGEYQVTVRDASGCEASTSIEVAFDNGNNILANESNVFPIEIMENGMAKYDLMSALDPSNGDLDNDGNNGSVLDVSFYNTEIDAINQENQLFPVVIASMQSQVFARVDGQNDCYDVAAVAMMANDFCLLNSEACDNDPPVLLIPLECDGSGNMLPPGGVYEIFKKINGTIEPRPAALLNINGEWYFDPTEREGNFEVHYTYNEGGSPVTKIALFDIQSLNPQVIITETQICGNQPVLVVRTNPIGGELFGEEITGNLVVGSNKFYFVNPTMLVEGQKYYYDYFYSQTNGSGLVCSKTTRDSILIEEFPKVKISTSIDQYCFSQEVILESINVDNTPGLTYQWFDPNDVLIGTDPNVDISSIQLNGIYRVVATSPNGCSGTDQITIQINPLPILNCDINGTVTCPNGGDGEATVEILGATDISGYSFVWDDGSTGQTRSGLKAGDYKVYVTTEKGCVDSCVVSMTQPPLFTIDCDVNLTEPACFGEASGSNAVVIAGGGLPPYEYSSNGIDFQNTPTVGNLMVGTQNIYIRDAIGCIDSCSFTLTQPDLLTCSAVEVAPDVCNGDNNGRGEATGSGGVLPYSYLWDNGETTKIATMLAAGNHSVTVYDANLCESYCDITITEPDELICDASEVNAVVCFDGDDGQAMVNVEGGNMPYSYLWDNGETTPLAVSLNAGTHTVSITDSKGCNTTCQVLVTQPPVLTAVPDIVDACQGKMVFMDCNADPKVVNHFWEFDPNQVNTATGVVLEFTDQEDVKINAMNATPGIVYIRYLGSDIHGCEVEAFASAEIFEPPYSGEDVEITICNAEETEFIQDITSMLSNGAEPGGVWSFTSGQPTLNVSDLTAVDFSCQPAGDYTFRYELSVPSNCDNEFANVTIKVEDCFDVAIRKTVFSLPPYNLNDKVRFKLEVFNQGDIDAHEVSVTDYVTPEFLFFASDNTSAQTGNFYDWSATGNNAELFIGHIPANSVEVVFIDLVINPAFTGFELSNSAEITNYALETSNGFKYLPPDEDDKVTDPMENDDDIRDDSNNEVDNPKDDDQSDFAVITLCGGGAEEIACNDQVQISLDDDCAVLITPDMILEGTYYSFYDIIIKDETGNVIPNPVTGAYVGENLTITIIDKCSQNSCWSSAIIEDKLPPKIECIDDLFTICTDKSYEPSIPNAIDACEGNIPVTIKSDVTAQLPCTDEFQAVRTIVYYAKDSKGNKSKECTVRVYYRRVVFGDIVIPGDMELDCSDASGGWDTNNNYYPEPEESGIPTYLGVELAQHISNTDFHLISDNLCSVNVTYSDNVLPICGSTFKVLRTWSLLDWCSGSFYQDVQAIAISDNNGPVVTCVPDAPYEIVAEAHMCSSDWVVPAPIVIYDCDNTHYKVEYLLADSNGAAPINGIYIDDNVNVSGNGYLIKDLPVGRTWIKYTVYDECGNFTNCFTEVDVIDNIPPVPVCDEFTAVSLNSTGLAKVFALTFDDGSHDNCSEVTFGVRRTSGYSCPTNHSDREFVSSFNGRSYYNYVDFCCADLNREYIDVELLVIDASGNKNTCTVKVDVSLKIEPILTCPASITVDCEDETSPSALNSFADYIAVCDFYDVSYDDIEESLSCGEKDIRRTWKLVNTVTNVVEKSCVQNIYVRNNTPFNLNTVKFPADATLTNACGQGVDFSPENPATNGYPTWNAPGCSLVTSTYKDQEFTVVNDACFKIIRTWSVIDWCNFNPLFPNDGVIHYNQVIKVIDTDAPALTCPTFYAEVGTNCKAIVAVKNVAEDSCTPANELRWAYLLDNNNDGLYETYKDNDDTYNATLDVGEHLVQWVVEDRCGNSATCIQTIIVEDKTPPTPYCHTQLVTVLMETSNTIEIWSKDYDLGANDNCSASPLIFTFGGFPLNINSEHYFKVNTSGNAVSATLAEYNAGIAQLWQPSQSSSAMLFDCEDKGVNEVIIHVYDEYGNGSQCIVNIDIQSNSGLCPEDDGLNIAGRISQMNGDPFMDASVYLDADLPEFPRLQISDADGQYAFNNLITQTDYLVSPEYNVDYLNGVSTLDIVLIQRHILGLSAFDNPYYYLAADINDSGTITASDLVQLRKLILGFYQELPNNDSWRFVPLHEDINNDNIYYLSDHITVSDFDISQNNIDFTAVKIGDVNLSASHNVRDNPESDARNNVDASIEMSDILLLEGEIVRIPVYAADFDALYGMQFGFEYDEKHLMLKDFISGTLDVSSQNVYDEKTGAINFSWNETMEARKVNAESPLFYLEFEVLDSGFISELISLNDKQISPQLINKDLGINPLKINFTKENLDVVVTQLTVSQNHPNPFSDKTVVSYNLPKSGDINIKVTDMLGKRIEDMTFFQWKGSHDYTFDNRLHQVKGGVLFLTITDGNSSGTIKMLTLK